MTQTLAVELLDAFADAGVRVWVAGGWGIDALVGRQTREHRDLDVLYPREHDDTVRGLLADRGWVPETDWWPVRVEYVGASYVDVHPLTFAPDGSAVQEGLDGGQFFYPASAFVGGVIGGRVVECLSAGQQRAFHAGYEPRTVDVVDIALLDRLLDDENT
jgi:lincosamide nucleotidyltransferase A/C/D/E